MAIRGHGIRRRFRAQSKWEAGRGQDAGGGVRPFVPSAVGGVPTLITGELQCPIVPSRPANPTTPRPIVYAIDDVDFPVAVLSEHKEKDDAWTAFYDAVAASTEDLVFIYDVSGSQRRVVANSDDFDHLKPVRDVA